MQGNAYYQMEVNYLRESNGCVVSMSDVPQLGLYSQTPNQALPQTRPALCFLGVHTPLSGAGC